MPVEPTSYDVVPYESRCFVETHPDNLANIATLFGLNPPAIDRCRVLELGCSHGSNLIPMASALPGGTFLGVDLSARQIEEGQKKAAELGLKKLRPEFQRLRNKPARCRQANLTRSRLDDAFPTRVWRNID